MTIYSWLRKLFTRAVPLTIRKAQRPVRLNLETLEDRWCPSTFTVLKTLDDGSAGTLRWAVAQANSNPGADTINFALSGPKTITLGLAQLELTDTTGRTTINGPGVTVSGGGLNRVFQVNAGANASFLGLTITGGTVIGNGAGLYNLGNATLRDCIVTDNHAIGGVDSTTGTISGVGGGVGNLGGTLELINTTVSGNTADLAGGGVASASIPASSGSGKGSSATPEVNAKLNMTECIVTGNSAGLAGGVANGVPQVSGGGKGSISFGPAIPATLNMTECTVSDNLLLENGGSAGNSGIGYGVVNMSNARLEYCTITGNDSGGVFNSGISTGGGKGSALSLGGLEMANSTVSANRATPITIVGSGKGSTTTTAFGFGVHNLGSAAINHSTFRANEGGGVFNGTIPGGGKGSASVMRMFNSTVSEHAALSGSSAGPVFGVTNQGTAALLNCTVSGNDGGVNNVAGTFGLINTIVAGNTTADLQGAGYSGSKNNLIGTLGSGGLVDGTDGNIVGVATADLHLAPLFANGGPTETMALLIGSPAIDNGTLIVFPTLSANINNALTTSIKVTNTVGYSNGLYIKFHSEIMRITDVPNATTLTVARGQLGTTAAPHSIAVPPANGLLAADQTGAKYAGAPDIGAFEFTNRLPTVAPTHSYTVTSTLDDGSVGTLRWAITQANANPGADTIYFALSGPKTITLGVSQLELTDVTGTTTIIGPGVTVSGNGLNRVFQINAGASASFTGLTITGGSIIGNGAGLYNLGIATLTDCIVTGNHAVGGIEGTPAVINGVGGGVGNLGGTLELINSTVTGNTADLAGGGVANAGLPASSGSGKGSAATPAAFAKLNMTESTVSGNSAGIASGVVNGVPQVAGGGKGSTTLGPVIPATLNMHKVIVSGNLALENGGSAGPTAKGAGFGVVNQSTASLTNCTVSGNDGGGVFNGGASTGGGKGSSSAVLSMTNSTISDNLAERVISAPVGGGKGSSGPVPTDLGFGVFNLGKATLTNSTISGNATSGVSNSGPSSGAAKGSTFNPALTMINCTVSEHVATTGISNSGFGVINSSGAELINCTISGNDAGVNNVAGAALLLNTIVAGNTTADLQGAGYSGAKNNLIGAAGSGGLVDGPDGNIVGVATADLHLAPLGAYGGPTQTMALLPGSPAIDKGAPIVFTTLAATIDNAIITSITVTSTNGLGVGLYIKIQSEILRITDVISATTLGVARGQLGTTAAPHSIAGPPVNVTLAADQTAVKYVGAPDIGAFELTDRVPTVTMNTANRARNAPTIIITGTGFSTIAANNTVVFNRGAVGIVTAATPGQLTVTFTTKPTSLGALTAVVTSPGGNSGAPTQVATIVAAPTVTLNTAARAKNALTIVITGTGFSTTPANNTVVFNRGAVGTVTAATATQLTVTFTTTPTSFGSLTAVVTSNGGTSGAAVQVATVVAPPTVTMNTAKLGQNAATIIIKGTGFSTTPAKNSVVFNLGAVGVVTAATATTLTVTFTTHPTSLGNLTAVVTSNGGTSGAPVQVATLSPAPTVSNLTVATWTQGKSGFTGTMTISGGTPTYTKVSAAGVPPGLTPIIVLGNTIKFTGTPTVDGTFNGSITIKDSAGATVTKTFSITINRKITFNPAILPAFLLGQPYSQTITTTGGTGPVTLVVSALPAGLMVIGNGTSTVTVSGTPTAATPLAFTITATDSVGATATITIKRTRINGL